MSHLPHKNFDFRHCINFSDLPVKPLRPIIWSRVIYQPCTSFSTEHTLKLFKLQQNESSLSMSGIEISIIV